MPLVRSHSIEQLEQEGEGLIGRMTVAEREAIAAAGLRGCIATTDVHEYGKVLIETVLKGLGVEIIDGGISTDPNDLARQAQTSAADFIALSSYNGIALQFVTELRRELGERDAGLPVFIGGKLNRVPDGTNTSLPVDISNEIAAAGAIVCTAVDGMIRELLQVARNRSGASSDS
jgi:methylmalonyl-CoA mutase cobalamin-binding domain/chain